MPLVGSFYSENSFVSFVEGSMLSGSQYRIEIISVFGRLQEYDRDQNKTNRSVYYFVCGDKKGNPSP